MAFKWMWRIVLAMFFSCLLFYFVAMGVIYTIVIIPAIGVMILSRRKLFVVMVFLTIFLFVLIGSMAAIGYGAEIGASTNFFVLVYELIIPGGMGSNWSQALPLLFVKVLTTTMLILCIFIGFAYIWKGDEFDEWLLEAFSFFLLLILFFYTIFCIFAVLVDGYELIRTNFVSLLIWELLFVWLPFYCLIFMLYYFLGYIFRRI